MRLSCIDTLCLSSFHHRAIYPSANDRVITKGAIINVNAIVSGRNCDMLASIIAHLSRENDARFLNNVYLF